MTYYVGNWAARVHCPKCPSAALVEFPVARASVEITTSRPGIVRLTRFTHIFEVHLRLYDTIAARAFGITLLVILDGPTVAESSKKPRAKAALLKHSVGFIRGPLLLDTACFHFGCLDFA